MRRAFRLLNVFALADDPFSGNPLAVFEDASGLSEATMQGLARQFNLSETTFLLGPAAGADATVRIFTTTFEMPFAGHPTLGTAHVVRAIGGGDAVRLAMPVGVIPVSADGDLWTLTARPGEVLEEYDPDQVAAAVGLAAGEVLGPAQLVSTGSPQVVAQVASVDALRRATGRPELMAAFGGMSARAGDTLVYLFAPTGPGQAEARALLTEGTSLVEDPATGSACSNLGAWLVAQGRTGLTWSIRQGAQTGRPSLLHLVVDPDGTVRVGGLVRPVGSGEVVW